MSIPMACPKCGAGVSAPPGPGSSVLCPRCGESISAQPDVILAEVAQSSNPFRSPRYTSNASEDPLLRMIVPVGRSALAIAAGYFGLFAMLVFPAPVALLLGILAVRDIKRNPEKHGLGRAWFGLVMGAIFSLLLVLILGAAITESLH